MTRAAADVTNVKEAIEPGTHTALVWRARKIYREPGEVYANAHCELEFETSFELLVAIILSAQPTVGGVNKVTPHSVQEVLSPADRAAADRAEQREPRTLEQASHCLVRAARTRTSSSTTHVMLKPANHRFSQASQL